MIVIGAIVKDEHLDIREWAEWHRALGFDRIRLYDNNSVRDYSEELGDLIETGFVTVKAWPSKDPFRQRSMFNDFTFEQGWTDGDWGALIDPDEFIVLDEHATIQDFVADYAEHPGVALSWVCYGADGRIERPDTPVRQAYVKPAPIIRDHHNFKSICRFNAVSYWADVHRFAAKEGDLVNTRLKAVYDSFPPQENHCAHIDHYITKSWEDYVRRLERGNVTRGIRKIETFFAYNPDLWPRYAELVGSLDPSRFPTIQSDKDVQKMCEEVYGSDVFVRLTEAIEPTVPDDLFKTVCVMELVNFAALRLRKLRGKTPEEVAAARARMDAMVDRQIAHLRSLPPSLPNYRRHVVDTIMSTPFLG